MKNIKKNFRIATIAVMILATFSLSSCEVLLDTMAGMYSYPYPYGTMSYPTNNNYLLDPNYAVWQVQNGIYLGGTSGSSSTSSSTSSSSTSTSSTTTKTHKCGVCGGTGRMTETKGVPSFGNTKYCNECGKTVPDNHYHTKCTSCDGKGWW